jgi:hypothetical protein
MRTTTGTITTAGNSTSWANPYGSLVAYVEVSGTSGDVVYFEESADGTNWSALSLFRVGLSNALESTYTLTSATPPLWQWRNAGPGRRVRVRATTVGSSVTVKFHDPGERGLGNLQYLTGMNAARVTPVTPGTFLPAGIPLS